MNQILNSIKILLIVLGLTGCGDTSVDTETAGATAGTGSTVEKRFQDYQPSVSGNGQKYAFISGRVEDAGGT